MWHPRLNWQMCLSNHTQCSLYLMNFEHCLQLVVFCFGLVPVKFGHIRYGYFTDTGTTKHAKRQWSNHEKWSNSTLCNYALVIPYGIRDFGQHCFRQCLVPNGTKLLHEPMLICHQWDPLASVPGQYLLEYSIYRSALLVLCEGNSPVTGEFPPGRPVTRSFDVYFDRCDFSAFRQSYGCPKLTVATMIIVGKYITRTR